MHIVYATDSGYLFPTLVAASSAVAWASRREDLTIHILDCGITDDEWSGLETTMRSHFGKSFMLARHKIDMSIYDTMSVYHKSKGCYARLEIPQILHDVAWCVYADGDTLFTADPFALEAVWNDEYAIMGHHDLAGERQKAWHLERGLPWDDEHHICSGFCLMNLDWFRANDVTVKCYEILNKYQPPYVDQDALNIVCKGKIGLLPNEWGLFTRYADWPVKKGCFHYVEHRPWEMTQTGRFPTNSCYIIWFETMFNTVGRHPWRCRKPYWHYRFQSAVTGFHVGLWHLFNTIPRLRKRFAHIGKKHWPRKAVDQFIAR